MVISITVAVNLNHTADNYARSSNRWQWKLQEPQLWRSYPAGWIIIIRCSTVHWTLYCTKLQSVQNATARLITMQTPLATHPRACQVQTGMPGSPVALLAQIALNLEPILSSFGWSCVCMCVSWLCMPVWRANWWQSLLHTQCQLCQQPKCKLTTHRPAKPWHTNSQSHDTHIPAGLGSTVYGAETVIIWLKLCMCVCRGFACLCDQRTDDSLCCTAAKMQTDDT